MTLHAIEQEEVMAFLDGELEPARRPIVQAHIETCDECRALEQELRQVSARLASWEIADAPNGLPNVRRTLAGSSTIERRPASWWTGRGLFSLPRWVVGSALAALAGVVILTPWMLSPRQARFIGAVADKESPTVANRNSVAVSEPIEAVVPGRSYLQSQGQGGGGGGNAAPIGQLREGQARDRMIVRNGTMVLTSDRFDQVRESLEQLVARHEGRITSMNATGDPSSRRSLRATVGVPAARMDALLAALRGLGRVQEESLGSDDVTEAFRDLTLRTANARREEQRLVELLTRRTGDLADVLAVERELARVRLEIERMEAETRATQQRVDLATVSVTVNEQYRADLAIGALPLPVRFKNALVDGSRNALESLVSAALVVLQVAPMFMLWGLILAWPVRLVWRWMRASLST